jgi:serine/threonine protein kinase
LPKFRAGMKPPGLDNWTLTELRGLGECSEVWKGEDPNQPDHSPAALKFAIDPESRDRVKAGTELFTKVFELNHVAGILPLHSVFLESDPPCLESPFVYGYDLTGLMFEWKWRYNTPKPEAALKLVRRLAAILASAHQKNMVHRDLKPSNVLVHPTEGGKFTMWVTDFGWGQIESVRSLELARGGRTAGPPLRCTPRRSRRRRSRRPQPTTSTRSACCGINCSAATRRPRPRWASSGWRNSARTGSRTARRGCCRRVFRLAPTSGRGTLRRWPNSSPR